MESFQTWRKNFGRSNKVHPSGIPASGAVNVKRNTTPKPRPPPVETDPIVLVRRQKQLDYGINTPEYWNYLHQVPKEKRESFHPKTPDKSQKCSRRSFDGQVRMWRLLLHAYQEPHVCFRCAANRGSTVTATATPQRHSSCDNDNQKKY